MNSEHCEHLNKHAKKFLLATKPAPKQDSPYKGMLNLNGFILIQVFKIDFWTHYKESDHLQLGKSLFSKICLILQIK